MMAVNVTQKDETLKAVIAYCEHARDDADSLARSGREFDYRAWNSGKVWALTAVIAHCRSMLGYSGSMPLEVPNRSEDAGTEVHHA